MVKQLGPSFFLILSLVCGANAGSDKQIEERLKRYFSYLSKGEVERSYDYLSSSDQAAKNLDNYLDPVVLAQAVTAQAFPGKFNFRIQAIRQSGKYATAEVIESRPVLPRSAELRLFKKLLDYLDAHPDQANEPPPMSVRVESANELKNNYPVDEITSTSTFVTYRLLFEDGQWKIFNDWKREEILRKREGQRKKESALSYAKKFIELREVEVKRFEYDGSVSVTGWIKNRGPKIIRMVSLSISLLDTEGKSFLKKEALTLGPFEPGHQKDFLEIFIHPTVPRGWKDRVNVEVENLEFQER